MSYEEYLFRSQKDSGSNAAPQIIYVAPLLILKAPEASSSKWGWHMTPLAGHSEEYVRSHVQNE